MSSTSTRHSLTIRRRGVYAVAAAAVAAGSLGVTATAFAKDGDGTKGGKDVRSTVACGKGSMKLKAKYDDGGIETEVEVDRNVKGEKWAVTLLDNDVARWAGERVTGGVSGSFSIETLLTDKSTPAETTTTTTTPPAPTTTTTTAPTTTTTTTAGPDDKGGNGGGTDDQGPDDKGGNGGGTDDQGPDDKGGNGGGTDDQGPDDKGGNGGGTDDTPATAAPSTTGTASNGSGAGETGRERYGVRAHAASAAEKPAEKPAAHTIKVVAVNAAASLTCTTYVKL